MTSALFRPFDETAETAENMYKPEHYTPSDRDVLLALLDGLLALSDRLFPDEIMTIKLIDTSAGGTSFAYASGPTLTSWERR